MIQSWQVHERWVGTENPARHVSASISQEEGVFAQVGPLRTVV